MNLRASVGTTGDSYNNVLAATVNGLYKTVVIEDLKSDCSGLTDVELASLNWVDWFNKSGYIVLLAIFHYLSLKICTMIKSTP